MGLSFRVIAEPFEPITLQEAKSFCRVDFTDADTSSVEGNDSLLMRLISAARKYVETVTGKALATQTVRANYLLERPIGGDLSGPIMNPVNWYQFEEQLGANPFGATAWYFDLPMAPLQAVSLIETRIDMWNPWITYTGVSTVDIEIEPGRVYLQAPPTVLQWRFTYTAGYDATASYLLPHNLRTVTKEIIAFWLDHREGDKLPDGIQQRLLAFRGGENWV